MAVAALTADIFLFTFLICAANLFLVPAMTLVVWTSAKGNIFLQNLWVFALPSQPSGRVNCFPHLSHFLSLSVDIDVMNRLIIWDPSVISKPEMTGQSFFPKSLHCSIQVHVLVLMPEDFLQYFQVNESMD